MKLTRREKKVYEWLKDFYKKDGKRIDEAHKLEHILRVLYWVIKLQKIEGGDIHVLIPAVFLHDVGQAWDKSEGQKMHAMISADKARGILSKFEYSQKEIDKICETIELHSSRFASPKKMTLEGKIIYDADKIDASDVTVLVRASKNNNKQTNKWISELILKWIKKWQIKSNGEIFYTKEGKKIGLKKIKITEKLCKKILKEEEKIQKNLLKLQILS